MHIINFPTKIAARIETLIAVIVVAFLLGGGLYGYHKIMESNTEAKNTNIMVQELLLKGNARTTLMKVVHEKFSTLTVEDQVRLTDTIYNICEIRNVPMHIILGMGETESRFTPKLTSSAGAKGWLQILPSTARPYLRAERMNYKEDALFDPVTCAIVGINLIADIHEGHMEAGKEQPTDFTISLHSYLWSINATAQLYGKVDQRVNVPNMAYPMRVMDVAKKYKDLGL